MDKVIVVGATSGIGRELAALFSRNGHVVAVVGRREPLLEEMRLLEELIAEMHGADIFILNAGAGKYIY